MILHPFATAGGPDRLIESSRASLMLQGLLPSGQRTAEELDRALLEGRYSEILMLFYVGKDLLRWIDQCLEYVNRDPELRGKGIRYQSFAALLVNQTPGAVQAKLRRWGVVDYRSIFTRALALNVIFVAPPDRATLADEFIRNYYRYADQVYASRQTQTAFTTAEGVGFEFEIFASGEYARLLEQEWQEDWLLSSGS